MLTEKQRNFHKGSYFMAPTYTEASKTPVSLVILTMFVAFLAACSHQLAISVNNRAVYDPYGRLLENEALDADLQGCINLALRKQGLTDPREITVLSCANSEIQNLNNIGLLSRLRFLDVSGNQIKNLAPLEALPELSGINLAKNQIAEIGPLFNIPSLTSVFLEGNNSIPCSKLSELTQKLEQTFILPSRCSP